MQGEQSSLFETSLNFVCSSSPVKQQARQFPHEKFAPEKCKEVEMISYLLDCYDRVNTEERKAPKVLLITYCDMKYCTDIGFEESILDEEMVYWMKER